MPPQHFAAFNVDSQVFLRTTLSCALVNLKPIIPGHVLVIPRRVVSRFADLSTAEVSDLYTTVQRVARVLNTRCYSHATASTISMQDGPAAGQSVSHVHVHVLPRGEKDLAKNDDVYTLLDDHSARLNANYAAWQDALQERGGFTAVDDESRKPRTSKDMEDEALWLASAFKADEEATSNNASEIAQKGQSKA